MRNGAWLQAGRVVVLSLVIGLVQAEAVQAEEPASRAGSPAAAAPAFDRVFSATSPGRPDAVGVAGKVVDRFTPPVAAPIDSTSPGQPLAQTTGPVLRPCDTPGSGCRNPQPISSQVGVPPIVPGTRPPRANP